MLVAGSGASRLPATPRRSAVRVLQRDLPLALDAAGRSAVVTVAVPVVPVAVTTRVRKGSRAEARHQHQRGEGHGHRRSGLAELTPLLAISELAGDPVHQFPRGFRPLRAQTRLDVAAVLTAVPKSPHRAPSDRLRTLIYRVSAGNLTGRSPQPHTIAAALRRGRATPRP